MAFAIFAKKPCYPLKNLFDWEGEQIADSLKFALKIRYAKSKSY